MKLSFSVEVLRTSYKHAGRMDSQGSYIFSVGEAFAITLINYVNKFVCIYGYGLCPHTVY